MAHGVHVSGTEQAFPATPAAANWPRWPAGRPFLGSSDGIWALAFVLPYIAVLLAFVLVPLGYALWMGSGPALYVNLWSDPIYTRTLVNTLIFVGLSVNVKMVLALLLSGFFMRRRRWIKGLLVVFMLPWVISAIPAFISFHWMLINEQGFINSFLRQVVGVQGPLWLSNPRLALGANIVAYIWKWLPFWTLVLLAARMAVPPDIYEAAQADGAGSFRRFTDITLPLIANVYVIATLLSVIWTVGDFTIVFLVSGGGPFHLTEVVATLANRYWFDYGRPELGIAAAISVLPLLIPIAIMLMRRVNARGVQL
jgi:multiple sugar transport system permease protein